MLSNTIPICWKCNQDLVRMPLKHCVILVTERCNSKCRICEYGRKSNDPRNEMSKQQLIDLIAEAQSLGCNNIILSGGEPLLRDDIFEIFHEVCKRGIESSCAICTNGILIDEKRAKLLAEAKPSGRIVISLDEHTAELNDMIRGAPGTFSRAVAAIKRINEAFGDTKHVGVNTIINHLNIDHIESIIRFVASLGVCAHKLVPVYGPSASSELRLTQKDLLNLYSESETLAELAKSLGLVLINLSPYALVETGGCHIPSFVTTVDASGRLYGCNVAKGGFRSSQSKPLGIFKKKGDLKKIWFSRQYETFRNRALTKKHVFCSRACPDVTAHTMNFLHGPCGSCLKEQKAKDS